MIAARSTALGPNAALEARIELTPDVHRLVVRPDIPVDGFRPGQYFSLGLVRDGSRPLQRPYSAASAPGSADRLEFLIRRVPDGALTPTLWRLSPGARLRIGRPKGLFTLLPDDTRTHLFVASGTGVAPFISMIESLGRLADPPPVVVVHGVARVAELAYRDRFEDWSRSRLRIRYEPTISRPTEPGNAGWTGRFGRAESALADVVTGLGKPRGIVAYLCGNPGMIASAEARLRALGVADDAIVTERYWTSDRIAA